MPGKYEYYAELAEKTAKRLTDSVENWTSFLTTAARLYKYPYHEQLMIFAQRPDATACADYETWNKRMGRYVKRGSTGIALLDDSGSYPKLRYVFDVSDTGARSNSRDVKLWTMEERHRDEVSKALGDGDLTENIEQNSSRLAREYWNDHQRDIIDIVANSFLEEYNIDTIGARFCKAAAVSSAYAIMSRCGMNPDEIYDHKDFLPVFEFNTPDTIAALGTAVSDVSEQILRQIEAIIKNYERTNEHDKPELHENRRLPDPNLTLSETPQIGKYGRMRRNYLKEHRPILYNRLLLSEKLYPHLAEIDQTANRRLEQLMDELTKANGLTEQMKSENQMLWVQTMNNLKSQAEEIILTELIYS